MSVVQDIAAYLGEQGIATFGTDLFVWHQPDQPNALVALFDYPGIGGQYEHDQPAPAIEFPRFTVNVRDAAPDVAESRSREIAAVLEAIRNQTINGTRFLAVRRVGSGGQMTGRDDSNRYVYVVSYEATISR